MDLPTLISELHLRGLGQERVDSSLRCLVHVHEVQNFASAELGGVIAEDVLNTYDMEVVQAASQLFLERSVTQGKEIFRVKWGCEGAAKEMEGELWEHSAERWEEYVSQLDGRYLGFFLPGGGEAGRVANDWKLSRELKWFSVKIPRQGWKILGMIDDISEVALRLDLAFAYRPHGADGVRGTRVLLHERAYGSLGRAKVVPRDELVKSIRLWRFFSEYDSNSTDFVKLMKECVLTLEEVRGQIEKFSALDLTSQYREGQYPPYVVNGKKKKEFSAAMADLLRPMDEWLTGAEPKATPALRSAS